MRRDGHEVTVAAERRREVRSPQSQAGAGEIVLSEGAYRRVKDWLTERKFSATPRDFELKGFDRPMAPTS